MALSLEDANLTWRRVKIALADAEPTIVRVLRELKATLAQVRGNPNLQLVTFTDADVTGTDGVVIADVACKVYAVYVRKTGTSGTGTATDAHLKIYDDATDDSTLGDMSIVLPLLAVDEEMVFVNPSGVDHAAGVVATAHQHGGTTDSSAGDAGPGFVLLGAA